MRILNTMIVHEQHGKNGLTSYRDIFVPIHGSDRHIISRELAGRSKVIRLSIKHDDVAIHNMSES